MIRDIYSRDAAFQKLQVLKGNRNKRHRYGQFLVEGVRNLNQAVMNGWEISSFVYPRDRELSRWALDMLRDVRAEENLRLSGELMEELSGKAVSYTHLRAHET